MEIFNSRLYLIVPGILAVALVFTFFTYQNQIPVIGNLRSQVSNLTNQTRDLSSQLTSANGKIQDLQSTQTKSSSDFQNLQQQYNTLQSSYSQLQSKYGSLIPLKASKISTNPPIYYDSGLVQFLSQTNCTGDMQPAINCNDAILQYKPQQDDISIGDIITFYQPIPTITENASGCSANQNVLVMHRVFAISSFSQNGKSTPLYQTKGDSNSFTDPCNIPFSWITGKIYAIVNQPSQ